MILAYINDVAVYTRALCVFLSTRMRASQAISAEFADSVIHPRLLFGPVQFEVYFDVQFR